MKILLIAITFLTSLTTFADSWRNSKTVDSMTDEVTLSASIISDTVGSVRTRGTIAVYDNIRVIVFWKIKVYMHKLNSKTFTYRIDSNKPVVIEFNRTSEHGGTLTGANAARFIADIKTAKTKISVRHMDGGDIYSVENLTNALDRIFNPDNYLLANLLAKLNNEIKRTSKRLEHKQFMLNSTFQQKEIAEGWGGNKKKIPLILKEIAVFAAEVEELEQELTHLETQKFKLLN